MDGIGRVSTWMLAGCLAVLILGIQANPMFAQSTLPNLDTSADDKPGKTAHKDQSDRAAETSGIEVPDEIRQFFLRLRQAAQRGQSPQVLAFFDIEALMDSVLERGVLSISGDEERALFLRGMHSGFEANIPAISASLPLDRLRFLSLDPISESRVAVVTRSFDSDLAISLYMKWWLIRTDGEWQVYDFQDIDSGLRVSALVGVVAGAALDGSEWLTDFGELIEIHRAWLSGQSLDAQGLVEACDRLLEFDLPADCHAFVLVTRLGGMQVLDDFDESMAEEALMDLDELRDLKTDTPVEYYLRGIMLSELERHEEAIQAFETYANRLTWDADVCEMVADAWAALDKDAKAVEFALRGLSDNAGSVGCLMTLAVALPADRKSEMDVWLQRHGFAEGVLEGVIDWCLANDDTMGALHGFKHLRRHHPNSYLIDYYNEVMNITDY